MHILDILLFLEVGIALGIEALELSEEELKQKAAELEASYEAERTFNPAAYFHAALEHASTESSTASRLQALSR